MDFVKTKRSRPSLNITPLIDIIFLLIVFFMLTSNFALNEAIDLSITSTQEARSTTDDDTLVLTLLDNQQFALAGKTYTLSSLKRHIVPILGNYQQILIVSKQGVSVQTVVTTMDTLSMAGGTNISLAKDEGN